MTNKRKILAAAALSMLLPFVQLAHAQPKPLRLVVPYPPGGSPDQLARIIAEKLQQTGKYAAIVDNRPGAGGSIAATFVKSAPADGSTLLLADSSTYSIGPAIRRNLAYDPKKDFKSVGLAATSPLYLVGHPRLGSTVNAFLENLKSKPGQAIASSGSGTAHHLLIELMKHSAGLDVLHVPYRGSSQTVPAVLAGDVSATFSGLANVLPMAQAGKLTILAIAEPQRSSMSPDIPTLIESGLQDVQLTITLGLLAPVGTSDATIKVINDDIATVLRSADTKSRMNMLGLEAATSTPEAFGQRISTELNRYGDIVRNANITVE